MIAENYISVLRAIYKDHRDAVLESETQMILRVATYAALDRKDRLSSLTTAEQATIDSLDADFAWVSALQATRDQAIADINNAADDAEAQAVIDNATWPVR
jgi:hypothetical protein